MGIAEAIRSRGKLSSVQHEQAKAAGERLGRIYGLRLNVGRLDEDGRLRLIDLVRKATPSDQVGYGGINLRQLDKGEQREVESLVERAAGLEKGALAKRREEAEGMRRIEQLAREAMRPPRRSVWEEEGAITFPAEVGEQLKSGVLWIEHVGVLYTFLRAFELVEPLPNTQFEGTSSDLVLLVDSYLGVGLGKLSDSDEIVGRWQRLVDHLAATDYLIIEKEGRSWRVRLGAAATKIRRGKPGGKGATKQ